MSEKVEFLVLVCLSEDYLVTYVFFPLFVYCIVLYADYTASGRYDSVSYYPNLHTYIQSDLT